MSTGTALVAPVPPPVPIGIDDDLAEPSATQEPAVVWRDPMYGGYDRLDVLEKVIERAERSFIARGQALSEIRGGLYIYGGANTFGEYLRDRWGMSRSRAYQLIDAYIVSTVVDSIPNEAVARELAPLKHDPDAIREVWSYVTATHDIEGEPKDRESIAHPTAELVRAKVATYLGQQRRQVAAGTRPFRMLTAEEFEAQFGEAEALILSLARVRDEGRTYDALAHRMLKVVTRLALWTSRLSGWEVDVTINGDDAEAEQDGAEAGA